MKRWLLIALASLLLGFTAQEPTRLAYPQAKKANQIDDFFGRKVADPYRWLEEADSPDTRAWIEAENRVTFSYLETVPERVRIRARLTALWNYERYGVPSKEGAWYIFSRNDGLQNQSVIYRAKSLEATPEVLIDPNRLSADGTVALGGMSFSEDGKYMAYALAASGSDWREWHLRDVATGTDLPDLVPWSKFSGAAWREDGSGFYYGRYDEPRPGEALQAINKNQKVYFHKRGTSQAEDDLVYARPDQPEWGFDVEVTEDGRFLLIYQTEGTDPKNRIFVKDLSADGGIESFLSAFDASYTVVGNDGDRFYVLTDNGAPRYRLVAIDRANREPSAWKSIIPEASGRDVLSAVEMVNDQFVAVWQTDAYNKIRLYGLDGSQIREVALPGIGSVSGLNGKRKEKEAFYAFTSFTYPTTPFRYDFTETESFVFRKPKVDFDAGKYETVQVFHPSKDGTRIPMFLTYRKGLERNGQNPTYLYGYGGFNVSSTPSFSPANAAWLEMGGIYALANLRGGGEYGKEWHDAGRLKNKQNVFDDFIAAAEYLIREKYTSTPKLAIAGGSNGGLLVGACITQRPDLFGAAVPAVGVMDMLRFHKFTIGWAWVSDYGSAETREGFETLIQYSPLHNIKPGVNYPATLVTTADHDDRVVPAHSFKFTAALQAASAGPAPVLIRIETKAGHGAGKPTAKIIEERADVFAFLVRELGVNLPADFGRTTATAM